MMLNRLTLSINQSCNLRCKYCFAQGGGYGEQDLKMSPETAILALKKMVEKYHIIQVIQFFGGEPMFNLNCMEAVANQVKEMHINGLIQELPKLSIVTNLTYINNEIITFLRNNKVEVVVSLDGPENINDFLRPTKSGKGTYNRIIKNIKKLRKNQIAFDIECTFTAKHIENGFTVANLIEHFYNLGSRKIDIVPAMVKPLSQIDVYSPKYLLKTIELYVEAIHHTFDSLQNDEPHIFGIVSEIIGDNTKSNRYFCPAGSSNIAIAADGSIYPCHMMINQNEYKMGNIFQNVLGPTFIPPFRDENPACTKCWARPWCGSCMGRMIFYNNSASEPYLLDCKLKMWAIKTVIERLDQDFKLNLLNRTSTKNQDPLHPTPDNRETT